MNRTDLCYLSAVEQKALLDKKEVSVSELVDAQIAQIERHNPALNAFVTLRLDEARDEARAADKARAEGTARGVLHGLTVGVKDCFATRGIRTTFASKAFEHHVPDYDHLVVEREKAQGMIVLGKLNTPEYTMASNLCDNPVFGKTRSPYGKDRAPGASSGASGAALAAGLCSLADGSDIGGSVRNPAAWNNVVGHRPTSWMIPDVPNPLMWHNMNTPGPMARTVADTALFLSALAGPDPRCPVVVNAPFAPGLPDLVIDMKGLRVGWSSGGDAIALESDLAANFEAQRAVFSDLGCVVEQRDIDLSDLGIAYEVLAFQRVSREVEPAVGRGLDGRLEAHYHKTRGETGAELMDAETRRHRLWNDVALAFAEHDVLVWPDDPVDAYAYDDEEGSESLDWSFLFVSPMLGLPTITVPCGFSPSGSPRGLQILGRPGMDLLILQVARAYEQATQFGTKRPELD